VLGYFSLALQVLKIPETFSNRKIKELDGFNAKIHGERILEFPAILIGQLAKNDLYRDHLSGYKLMQYCLSTLLDGQIRPGGRIVMLHDTGGRRNCVISLVADVTALYNYPTKAAWFQSWITRPFLRKGTQGVGRLCENYFWK